MLKIFDPTLYLASTTKKDTLILDFSEILSSQAAVTIAKTFNKFEDGIVKFVHNLSSGCSRIDIVCDSYFDKSLKSDTLAARVCGQLFPVTTEATNIPKDFQDNFLRHKRSKRTLKLILAVKLLIDDFGRAVTFISVNSEVKCYSTAIDISEEDINPHCFAYERVLN